MSSSILLLVAVSCILVGLGRADVVNEAIDSAENAYDDTKDFVRGNETSEVDHPDNSTQQEDRPALNNSNQNDLTNTNNNNNNDNSDYNYGNTRCMDCTIEKSMDNALLSVRDETTHQVTSACKEYECTQASQDWCLVTYYRMKSYGGVAERKLERHECGNKNQRDMDTRCKNLRIDDESNVMESCETKRSGARTISYSIFLSLLSVLFFLYNH